MAKSDHNGNKQSGKRNRGNNPPVNRGFPVTVSVMGEDGNRVINNAKEFEELKGLKKPFRIVKNEHSQKGGYKKKEPGNGDMVSLPGGLDSEKHTWVKKVTAYAVKTIIDHPDKPKTHKRLILKDFPDSPVDVTNEWYERWRPKSPKAKDVMFIDHRNNYYTLSPAFIHGLNFEHAPAPETPVPQPDVEDTVKPAEPSPVSGDAPGELREVKDQQEVSDIAKESAEALTEATGDDDRYKAIIGTDSLPANVEIAEGQTIQLGDIVKRAFDNTGVSVEDWNGMEGKVRDAHIHAALDQFRAEAQVSKAE